MDSYVVMEAYVLRQLCQDTIEVILDHRKWKYDRYVDRELAASNKWRRRFRMRLKTREQVVAEVEAGRDYKDWHHPVYGLGGSSWWAADIKLLAEELRTACEISNVVHVATKDYHTLRSMA